MAGIDDARLFHEEVAHWEVDCLPTSFNSNSEYIVINEVTIEHDLNRLWSSKRSAFSEYSS